jgi:hypothetical protein
LSRAEGQNPAKFPRAESAPFRVKSDVLIRPVQECQNIYKISGGFEFFLCKWENLSLRGFFVLDTGLPQCYNRLSAKMRVPFCRAPIFG